MKKHSLFLVLCLFAQAVFADESQFTPLEKLLEQKLSQEAQGALYAGTVTAFVTGLQGDVSTGFAQMLLVAFLTQEIKKKICLDLSKPDKLNRIDPLFRLSLAVGAEIRDQHLLLENNEISKENTEEEISQKLEDVVILPMIQCIAEQCEFLPDGSVKVKNQNAVNATIKQQSQLIADFFNGKKQEVEKKA